jgi:hypothetical protein
MTLILFTDPYTFTVTLHPRYFYQHWYHYLLYFASSLSSSKCQNVIQGSVQLPSFIPREIDYLGGADYMIIET